MAVSWPISRHNTLPLAPSGHDTHFVSRPASASCLLLPCHDTNNCIVTHSAQVRLSRYRDCIVTQSPSLPSLRPCYDTSWCIATHFPPACQSSTCHDIKFVSRHTPQQPTPAPVTIQFGVLRHNFLAIKPLSVTIQPTVS